MKKTLLLLTFFLSSIIYAQLTWEKLDTTFPIDDLRRLNQLKVIDQNNVLLSFEASYRYFHTNGILKSIDGGETWTKIYEERNDNIVYDFINKNIGYFIEKKSSIDIKLGKTTDGGSTWSITDVSLCDSCTLNIDNLYFENENNGIIHIGTEIFNTNDGGQTWSQNSTKLYKFKIDRESGKGLGNYSRKIYETTDHGKNWREIFTVAISPSVERFSILDLDVKQKAFVGIYDYGDTGPVSGTEGGFFRVTNGSHDFTRIVSNVNEFSSVASLNDNLMYVFDRIQKNIYEVSNFKDKNERPVFTKNLGITTGEITRIVTKDNYGYAYGYQGRVYKLSDSSLSNPKNDNSSFTVSTNNNEIYIKPNEENSLGKLSIKLYTINGKLIKSTTKKSNLPILIKYDTIKTGIYILSIQASNGQKASYKLFLKK